MEFDWRDIHRKIDTLEFEKVSEMLVEKPELANAANPAGQTVFWCACGLDQGELVDQMLDEPIRPILDVFKCDRLLRSPMDIARHYNNSEIIKRLNPIFGVGVYSSNDSIEDGPG